MGCHSRWKRDRKRKQYAYSNIPQHCLHTHCPFQASSRHDVPKAGQYSKLNALSTSITQDWNTGNRKRGKDKGGRRG